MIETRTVILSYADGREYFRFADLFVYLNSLSEINKVTLSWHLREMVKESVLYKLGRGIYTVHNVQTHEYTPRLSNKTIKACKSISQAFPFISVSGFDGEVIADFQHHLSSNNLHYIEVDREAMESVFHFLKQKGHTAYLNPNKEFVYDNIDFSKDAFIVKPLITESPMTETQGIKAPRLEKILVDIYCDDDMDYLHGNEWNRIFDNAHALYSVNRTMMLRYASRRNAKAAIEKAIENLGKNYD